MPELRCCQLGFIATGEIFVVALVVASGLMGSFLGFYSYEIMWLIYFKHVNVIFVLFTFHTRRLITSLQGSSMTDKMSEIIKTDDRHRQRNVEQEFSLSSVKNSPWKFEMKFFPVEFGYFLSSASWFHQFDSVVLLWHPDLLSCGKEVKHFMALHCLGCFYNSLDGMTVL